MGRFLAILADALTLARLVAEARAILRDWRDDQGTQEPGGGADRAGPNQPVPPKG